MLLAIDIGNTNITIGVFKADKEPQKKPPARLSPQSPRASTLVSSWRISTNASSTADEYGTKILDLLHYATIERAQIKAIAIASVVPPLTAVFEDISQKYFNIKPLIIGQNVKVPILNLYDNPKEVGADRIVNAVAAYARFGGPCIVVDFGTATSFDCLTKKGEYTGGVIVPGPKLSAESLYLHTAKLPKVEMAKPQRLIGRNTVESIQSGLYYGYVELVDGLIERLQKEMGSGTKVTATGGLAYVVCQDSKYVRKDMIVPELTLEGLSIIYEKNSPAA